MFTDELIVGNGDDSYFIGGEVTYLYTELITSYDIYSSRFNELRNKFLENPNGKLKDIYFEKRKIYQNKLMELFTLNATTIQELDEELYELCLLDDESFVKVIFHRHQIFEKIMSVCLNQFLNELKHDKNFKKYFENEMYKQISHNTVNVSNKQYYIELLKILHKVINNIILEEHKEIKLESFKPEASTLESSGFDNGAKHPSSKSQSDFVSFRAIKLESSGFVKLESSGFDKTKLINRYCDSCIHNRIFKYCDFIIEKIKKNKLLMHKLENDIIEKGLALTNLKLIKIN